MKKEQSLETQEEHDEEAASVDLSETPHGEDTTSDNVTPTTSKSKDKPPEIITEGARWVLFSKILVLLVLMGCAAAAAYIAYDFTSDKESQEFENQVSYSKESAEYFLSEKFPSCP